MLFQESVLDEKMKSVASSDIPPPSSEPAIPPYAVENLHHSHLNLKQAIVKYEAIVEHLDRVWEEQVSTILDFGSRPNG